VGITFNGKDLGRSYSSGTITGTGQWSDMNGTAIVSGTLTGVWENDRSGVTDVLDFTVTSADGRLSFSDRVYYETAGEIGSGTFVIGGCTLDGVSGSWHTNRPEYGISIPDVDSAILLNTAGTVEFHDIDFIGDTLYATIIDGSDYSLVSIDINTGNIAAVSGLSCDKPVGIASDGINTWIVGKDGSPDVFKLFKYSGTSFGTDESGYPIQNTDLAQADNLSWDGSSLYYHNGSILGPVIGTINAADGSTTEMITGGFGGPQDFARTKHIAAVSGDYYTIYVNAGGEWCEIRKLDSAGDALKSYFTPVNNTGPVTMKDGSLYIIHGDPNRLYIISL